MKRMRKWIALLLGAQLLVTGLGAGNAVYGEETAAVSASQAMEDTPGREGKQGELVADFWELDEEGNIILGINGNDFAQLGFEVGDILAVTIGKRTINFPVGLQEKDVKKGQYLCILHQDESPGRSRVILSLRGGSLGEELGLSSSKEGKEESILISMLEPEGYLETYLDRNLKRYKTREKYPQLSDSQYANFRMVETTGMPSGLLYRSSSPVDDALGRCKEADAALEEAGIKTILNLANSEKTLFSLEGYRKTNYCKRTIFARKMRTDPMDEEFRKALPAVLRFMMANQGPYLIHCKAGKDRTGFVCALLESLLGASVYEVIEDYMVTYYNYYGIRPEEERYAVVAKKTIQKQLEEAFGVENLWGENVSLYEGARNYLLGCGMSSREIDTLRKKLSGK